MGGAPIPKTGTHTNDRVNVGTVVTHTKTNAGKKSGKTVHSGQPTNMAGKGLNTGHTATNC